MTIKLKDIVPAPWNTRGEITAESVKELAQSIEEQGLINPITLWSHDFVVYCIAGNRRLEAMKTLGRSSLKDQEYTNFSGDEHEAKMVTLTENLQREDVGIIEEAECVAALLDEGKTTEWIAARLGRGRNWVNRRRKLVNLAPSIKEIADKLDADALEHIAAYPVEVQDKLKYAAENGKSWSTMKYAFDREMHDIDAAPFDTKPCRECLKRTGVEADLFGVCDGKLGSCLDCKCFNAKVKAFVDAEVERLTKGCDEVVRVKYAWELPREDESSPKRTKKHPCAYVFVREYDGYEVEVKFGESKAAKEAAAKKAEEARKAAREEEAEKRAKTEAITDKLDVYKDSGECGRAPEEMFSMIVEMFAKDAPEAAVEFVCDAICDKFMGWQSDRDWAEILTAFPKFGELAGLTEAEAKFIIDEYGEDAEG